MKTSKKTFIFFLLAGLMVSSCGKNNSSSSDNNWGGGIGSNVGNGNVNLDQQSQQVIQRLNEWYRNAQNGQEGYASVRAFAKARVNQNQNNNQECLRIGGFNLGCVNWSYSGGNSTPNITHKTCVYPNISNSNNSVTTKSVSVNSYCSGHVGENTYHINNNTELNELFKTNNNGLVVIRAQEIGNTVIVWLGLNNGYQVPTKAYVIDRSAHSIYNPVQIMDQSGTINTYQYNY